MDRVAVTEKVTEFLKKYRYVALVLLAGLILMAMPEEKKTESAPEPEESETGPVLQEELEDILSHIQGAGKVRVLLTLSCGEEIIYQTDRDSDTETLRTDTVILTGESREETGLVRQINPPQYLGAVVVCQGADNASVKLAIVEAVSNATGLTTDRISVLKMK